MRTFFNRGRKPKGLFKNTARDHRFFYSGFIIAACFLVLCVILFSGCPGPDRSRDRMSGTEPGDGKAAPARPSTPVVSINNVEDIKKGLDMGNIQLDKAWKILDSELIKNPNDPSLLVLKARLLWSEGKFNESYNAIQDALMLDSKNTGALSFKIILLLDNFKGEEAYETLKKLLEINPDSDESRMLKARVMMRLKNYDEAQKSLEEIIRNNPGNLSAHMWLIDVYDESLRMDDGIKFARRALRKKWPDKDRSVLTERLGQLYERMGNEKESIKLFEEALKIDPNNNKARIGLATSVAAPSDPLQIRSDPAKLRGKVEGAMDDTENARFNDEDEFARLFALGQLNVSDGHLSLAKANLYRAVNKFPMEASGYKALGYYTLNFKEYREAQKAYQYTKKILPYDYDALTGEALVAIVRRDPETAESLLSKINPPQHRRGEHYRRIADAYMFDLHDIDTAEKYYKKSLEYMGQGEDPIMSLVFLGNIELKRGNVEKAEDYFYRALAKLPEDVENNILAKFIYRYIQKHKFDVNIITAVTVASISNHKDDLTQKYINEWKSVDDKLTPRERGVYYLKCGRYYLYDGNMPKTHEMIDITKKVDPTHPMINHYLGRVYMIEGDREKAKICFKKMLENTPEDAYSWFNLGMIAEEEGDKQLAQTYYKEAKKGFRSPGDIDFHKAWVYCLRRDRKNAVNSLRAAINKDIFNACRALAEDSFDWMRDDPFFKNELPEILKQVKEKTKLPSEGKTEFEKHGWKNLENDNTGPSGEKAD